MYNSISMDSNYDICKTGLNDNNLSYSQKGNKELSPAYAITSDFALS